MDTLLATEGRQLCRHHAADHLQAAYQDFAEVDWPSQRHGLPVTLFVPSGFAQEKAPAFWWDGPSTPFAYRAPEPLDARRPPLEERSQRRRRPQARESHLWSAAGAPHEPFG